MDQIIALLAPYAPYFVLAVGVCSLLEALVDHLRPYVLQSATKRDDFVLEKVELYLGYVSKALSFLSFRLGRK